MDCSHAGRTKCSNVALWIGRGRREIGKEDSSRKRTTCVVYIDRHYLDVFEVGR